MNIYQAGRNYNARAGRGVTICVMRCTENNTAKFFLNRYWRYRKGKYIMTSGLKNGITRATNLCPRRFRRRIPQRSARPLKLYKSTSYKRPGGPPSELGLNPNPSSWRFQCLSPPIGILVTKPYSIVIRWIRHSLNHRYYQNQPLDFPNQVSIFLWFSEDLLGLCSAALKLTAWKTWWVAGSIKLFYH